MEFLSTLWMPIVLSAIFVFIVSSIIHMVLGYHASDYQQLPNEEQVMDAFRKKEVNVLLATSLIEVGVDISNATIMVIENAEQFGLAQLHQLRGRIGRGSHESYCILLSGPKPEGRRRLKILEATTDGFEIAEADLKLRGPGEMLGQEQSGMPGFRFGDLANDLPLIRLAKHLAQELPLDPGRPPKNIG